MKKAFETFWQKLEAAAREHGAIDDDMIELRSAVSRSMALTGWLQGETCDFVTENDEKNAISAMTNLVQNKARDQANRRQVRMTQAQPGFTVTKSSLSASTASGSTPFQAQPSVGSKFSPVMAKIGDPCPRCGSGMEAVGLVNSKSGLYCKNDRVVLPLSSDA